MCGLCADEDVEDERAEHAFDWQKDVTYKELFVVAVGTWVHRSYSPEKMLRDES
jgi:hypothetical protein